MAINIIALLKILLIQMIGIIIVTKASNTALKSIYINNITPLIIITMVVVIFSPSIWIAYVGVIFTMLFLGRNRDHAPGIFLFLLTSVPSFPYIWMIGSFKLIVLSSSVLLGLAAGLIAITARGKSPKYGSNFWIILVIFSLLEIYANARGTSFTNLTREIAQTLFSFVFPVLAMASLIARVQDFRPFVTYALATGVTLTAILVFESVNGWSLYRSVYAHMGIPPVWDQVRWRDGLLRASGPIMEATSMGFAMVFFTIFAWCSRGVLRTKGWRYIITAIIFFGVYVTQSRNPLVGLIVASAAYFIFWKMKKNDSWTGYAFAILVALSAIFLVLNMEKTIKTDPSQAETTLQYRKRLLDRGLEEVKLNPVFGQNMKNVRIEMSDLVQGEGIIDFVNSYLYIALFSGILGLMLFIFGILKMLFFVWSLRRKLVITEDYGVISFCFCMTTAVLTMIFFTFFFQGLSLIYFIFLTPLVWVASQKKPAPVVNMPSVGQEINTT